MRKLIIFFILIAFLSLSSCNFPIKLYRPAGDEIPFPDELSHTPEITANPDTVPEYPYDAAIFTESNGVFYYPAQSGDTIKSVARHFGVSEPQIVSDKGIDPSDLIAPGQLLLIPNNLGRSFSSQNLLPDSELVYSPSAYNFDVIQEVHQKGGYLSVFHQMVNGEELSGAEIVRRVAVSNSINPRLLLAFIDYRSHWLSEIPGEINFTYPLGFYYQDHQGFYLECALAAKWLNMGYYGWRQGLFTELTFTNGSSKRVEPQLNAGSVAVQYLFSQFSTESDWESAIFGGASFPAFYTSLFGDPWSRAAQVEPLFPLQVPDLQLELPFGIGEEWALTGGLHYDWNTGTPVGALDFAPRLGESHCLVSRAWVLAPASGKIIYAGNNLVILDIYDDRGKFTGWQVVFVHIADLDQIRAGTMVVLDDPIGHPSCEGGIATGTHLHITRRYKGEWIGAGDPFPFVLSGWTALPSSVLFQGTLVKDGMTVTARQGISIDSRIFR